MYMDGTCTFSLCLRGGGGLSGVLCLFTSSSIVDLAWGWGECMSLREGLAAGVGTTSPPLSPGDFLDTHRQQSYYIMHTAIFLYYCWIPKIALIKIRCRKSSTVELLTGR